MASLHNVAARLMTRPIRRRHLRKLFASKTPDSKAQLKVERLEERENPAPVPLQFYYSPFPENLIRASMVNISGSAGWSDGNMTSVTSITASVNNTVVYLDHWEDGYDSGLASGFPVQSSTQIWGDGNVTNGNAPGIANDIINAGTIVTFRGNIPSNPRNPAVLFIDGGDKIASNQTIALTRALWGNTTGTVLATAAAVFDTRFYGLNFSAPVGTNIDSTSQQFEHSQLYIQASRANTLVQIDYDNNGTFDANLTLNEGNTAVTSANITSGARIVANQPIQVFQYTGDVGSAYESRMFNVVPTADLASDYFSPVGTTNTDNPVAIYVHNPTAGNITVIAETTAGNTTLVIGAGNTTRFNAPNANATHLYSLGNAAFAAVGVIDSAAISGGSGQNFDWGFTLQPTVALSPIAVVAWAPGTNQLPPLLNYSPVWVTPTRATTVYVDYDGNASTGPLVDPFGNRYDVALSLSRLQAQRVFDPDNDQTGMRLYTLDGTDISVAWGEDPSIATAGNPAMDLGTSILAFPVPDFSKTATLLNDPNGDGFFNSGDTIRYTLTVQNRGLYPILNPVISDVLPSELLYVANSTRVNGVLVPDSGNTPFPLDEGGLTVINIAVGNITTVTFDTLIRPALANGTTVTVNSGNLSFGVTILQANETTPITASVGDTIFRDLNGDGIQNGNDTGLGSVTVRLYRDTNNNGVLDGPDVAIANTTSNATGFYVFGNLAQGNYVVDVTDTGNVLVGSTLTLGTDPRAVRLGAGEANVAVDFGYALPVDLRATKTDGANVTTAIPGTTISYTIVVTNASGNAVANALVADVLPAALTNVSWTAVLGAGATGNTSGTGSINERVDLAPNANITYTLTGTILANATGSLVNSVSITPPTGVPDANLTNNTANDTNVLTPRGDLSITKTDGANVTTYVPGSSVTYTLVARNLGPSDLGNATVTDLFPANFTNATWTVAYSPGAGGVANGTGNINTTISLASGATATFTVIGTVLSNATGNLINTATIGGPPGFDGNLTNNTSTDTDTPDPQADLSVTKTDGANVTTYVPGGNVAYTIVARNTGPSDVSNATVTDLIPSNIINASWTVVYGNGATGIANGTGNINTSINLPSGGNATFTLTGTVLSNATGAMVNNVTIATPPGVTDGNLTNNSANDTNTPNPQADLSITKTNNQSNYTPGANITYTIVATNNGVSDVSNATVTDLFPTNLANVSWSVAYSSGASGVPNGTGNINTVLNLAAGSNATFTVVGTVLSNATGNLINTATIATDPGVDGNTTNNTSTDNDPANPQVDLVVTKTDGSTTYTPGGSITYTIFITNAGISDVSNATVTDLIPANITGASWSVVYGNGASGLANGTGNISTAINVPSGANATFTITGKVLASATGNLTNTVTVTSPPEANDPSANNTATDTDTLAITADLQKSLVSTSLTSTTGSNVAIGEMITYGLVARIPEGTTTALVIADALPPGLQYVSHSIVTTAAGSSGLLSTDFVGTLNSPTVNTAAGDGNDVSFDFGSAIATVDNLPNNSFLILLTVRVLAVPGNEGLLPGQTSHNNTATITATGIPPVTTPPVTTTVVEPELQVVKTVTDVDTSVDGGATVNYQIVISHTGNSTGPAFNIALADALAGVGLTLSTGTVVIDAPGYAAPLNTSTTNALAIAFAELGRDDTITITFSTVVNGNTQTVVPAPGNTVTNTSTVNYETAPENGRDEPPTSDTANITINSYSISGEIYDDTNDNGLRDGNETLITGVPITLTLTGIDNLGNPVNANVTTTNGTYTFADLRSSNVTGYTIVQTTQPASFLDGTDTAGTPFGGTGNATPGSDSITSIIVPTNALQNGSANAATSYNFGELRPASLNGLAWEDLNGSGRFDSGEPAVNGLSVTLTGTDDTGNAIAPLTTTTANGGLYSFTGLRPGNYSVTFGNQAGNTTYVRTTTDIGGDDTIDSDGNAATGTTASITLVANQTVGDVDQGLFQTVTLGDRVWFDTNSNGNQDAGEPGIPGATINITWLGVDGVLGGGDDQNFTTTTGANGVWSLGNLPPGNFTVAVTGLPVGLSNATYDLDSGTTNPDGTTAVSTASNQTRSDIDFGFGGNVSLSGGVYLDANNNAVRDPGEAPIANVPITLTGTDIFGNAVSLSTTTDVNGNYSFTNLIPGTYTLTETQPTAWADGTDTVGTVNSIPNGSVGNDVTGGIVLAVGDSGINYNFGERGGSIAGQVFLDANRDGNQQGNETTGVPGATVVLRDSGNTIVATVVTDASGNYLFENLAAGNYTVTETNNPSYGDPAAGPFAPNTRSITLPAGANSTNQDFGDTLASVTGTAYVDLDSSGTLTAGDTLLSGVNVTITGTGPGGAFTLNAITDGSGVYRFDNVPAGTITITETQPAGYTDGPENLGTVNGNASGTVANNTFANVVIPAGATGLAYNFGEIVPATAFIAGTVFVDVNRDGGPDGSEPGLGNVTIQLLNTGGTVIATTLTNPDGSYSFANVTPGNYTLQQIQPAAYGSSTPNLLTVIVPPAGLGGQNFGETVGTLSGRVYVDTNGDAVPSGSDVPLANVSLTLTGTDVNGDPVTQTTFTDASGNYTFVGLLGGNYTVTETQPAGFNDGPDTVGSAGGLLSAPDAIFSIPLGSGVNATGYNFGELGPTISGTVFNDRDRDGTQDPGEPGIPGVTILLIDANGDQVASTTTDGVGNYSFNSVPAGNYTIIEVQPSGYGDSPNGPFNIDSRPITVPLTGVTNQNYADVLGSLTGSVYIDANSNGVPDGGEVGIPGTQVVLTGTDVNGNPVNRVVAADVNGFYTFTELPASNPAGYTVTETQPVSFEDGTDRVGSIGGLLGNDTVTAIPFGAGVLAVNYDFGEQEPIPGRGTTFILGTVYLDRNQNGILDGTDRGFGANLTLIDLNNGNATVALTTSDPVTGAYLFNNIAPGNYRIVETQPFGYGSSEAPLNFRDVLVANTPITGQNFGETAGSITGIVYFDANSNGVFDAGDSPIANANVTLSGVIDTNGGPPQSYPPTIITTGADGTFRFEDLPAGTYQLGEQQPAGYADGAETLGTVNGNATGTVGSDNFTGIVIPAAAIGAGYNFGELLAPPAGATITGTVFLDRDTDGTPDVGEPGINGVLIELLNPAGTVVASTTTGPDGTYSFTGITPGTYTIRETQPLGYNNSPTGPAVLRANVTVPIGGLSGQNFAETLGSLSGNVFLDSDNDGVRDPGEPGLGGVLITVTGTDAAGNPINRTALTDGSGNYTFDDLPGGTYSVIETQPAGYLDGPDAAGTAGGSTATNDAITFVILPAGTDATGYNFAERAPATSSLGGVVYLDRNKDGAVNGNDTGLGGITIRLFDNSNTEIANTTTNPNGSYVFLNIGAGNYSIREDQPTGYGSSEAPTNSIAVAVPATPTPVTNLNFGETLGSLSGRVFLDANNNGIQDGNEAGLGGVQVELSGPVNRTAYTDASGNYTFTDLLAGSYTITETQPAGLLDGIDTAGSLSAGSVTNDSFGNITVPAAADGTGYNFAEQPPVTAPGTTFISGTVFHDRNRDGFPGGGEPGLGNVPVSLYDLGGNLIANTTTAQDGSYIFTGVIPGSYVVRETNPTGYGDSTPNDRTITVPTTGLAGQNFGDTLGSLSGAVYADLNGDGTRQPNEPGIGNTTVQIFDANNFLVATTSTAPDGSYLFEDLLAGVYRVVETQPAGFQDGTEAVGTAGGSLEPTDTIANVSIGAGVNASGYQFAEIGSAITGRVYIDRNQDSTFNGNDTGLGGVIIDLVDSGNNIIASTSTGSDGTYSFIGIPGGNYTIRETQPTGYGSSEAPLNTRTITLGNGTLANQNFGETLGNITGRVYADYNLNGNFGGTPDIGIANVTITLLDSGNNVVATTTSAADGTYSFGNLPIGNYTIVETQPGLPTASVIANRFYDGADNLGSLGGTRTAKNQMSFSLGVDGNTSISQSATGYNFGEVPPADPFGFVYNDLNRNGLRDPGEPGIAGVTITLSGNVTVVNANGTVSTRPITAADAPNGLVQITNATGRYDFNPIPAGVYTLRETQPGGYTDGAEQDADPNGPAAIIGNDSFTIILNPNPIRGPFNFGETQLLVGTSPLPPLTFEMPGASGDVSKRQFLGSTSGSSSGATLDLPTSPNYTSVNGTANLAPQYVAIAGDAGWVRVFDYGSRTERFRFQPYGNTSLEVRVAIADVNFDGIQDIITGAGPGGSPHILVFDGITGGVISSFFAFDPSFRGGVNLAAGDITGDGYADIVVGADAGGLPQVRVFDGRTSALISSFQPFESSFTGGVRVAVGRVNGDTRADVVVTAGNGGGPRVAGFDGASIASGSSSPTKMFADFYALNEGLRMGFFVSLADTNGDGRAEIFTSAGTGGGPRVTVFDGFTLSNSNTVATIYNFYAGDPNSRTGVRVIARDLSGDGRPEVMTVNAPGASTQVYTYDILSFALLDAYYGFSPALNNGLNIG